MKMRNKTKDELSRLAEIMVSSGLPLGIGTSEFLELALRLTRDRNNRIEIDQQSVRKYEKVLESKCQSLKEHIDYQITQNRVKQEVNSQPVVESKYQKMLNDNNFYDVFNNVIDERTILKRADEIRSKIESEYFDKSDDFFDDLGCDTFMDDINSIFDVSVVQKPVYTLFAEIGGKITLTRGKYSRDEFTNKSPKEINEIVGWSCMAGWANDKLETNSKLGENRPGGLTEDDKIVLRRIMRNEI